MFIAVSLAASVALFCVAIESVRLRTSKLEQLSWFTIFIAVYGFFLWELIRWTTMKSSWDTLDARRATAGKCASTVLDGQLTITNYRR